MLPLFAHYFDGRLHLLKYSICLVHMPPPSILVIWHSGLSGRMAASMNVCFGNSAMLLLILSWEVLKQIASSCWQVTTSRKLAFLVRATKALAVASEQGCSNYLVYMFTSIINDEAKPKAYLKHHQKMLDTRCLHEKKSPRGSAFAWKGHIFRNLW